MNNRPLIIYHADCLDGFGAAYAAWTKYGDNADYIAAHYGDNTPDVANREVFILDFSYPSGILLDLSYKAKKITILDHHKTAQSDIELLLKQGIIFGEFDMHRSGAVMAWNFFKPGEQTPYFLICVQDRDLWLFNNETTKEITAALMTVPRTFDAWHSLNNESNLQNLFDRGVGIVDYQQSCIDAVVKSDKINHEIIAGYKVPCINCTHLISEIGNELAKGNPFAALYFDTSDARIFSLRSADDGIDVSEIAKRYGGGGHYHAAGFKIKKPEFLLE